MNEYMARHGYGMAFLVGLVAFGVYLISVREILVLAGAIMLVMIGVAGPRLESLVVGPISLKMFMERSERAFTKKLAGGLTFDGIDTSFDDIFPRMEESPLHEHPMMLPEGRLMALRRLMGHITSFFVGAAGIEARQNAEAAKVKTPEQFGERLADMVITPSPTVVEFKSFPPTVSVDPPARRDDE